MNAGVCICLFVGNGGYQMNVFEAVKEAVSTRQAAESYGLRVNRNGMACCPFHNDKNPSMKVDHRYHCFACQADGDVIDYVANLFGLGKKDAAVKLAEDFGITYDKWKPPDPGQRKPVIKKKPLYQQFKEAKTHFWRVITDYYHLLCRWKEEYAPTDPEQEWDDRFVEALQNVTQLEYVMDTFLEGDLETQIDIINDYGRKIPEYERRIKGLAAGEISGIGENNEGDGTVTGSGEAA